ncbi:thioredoxin-like protein 2, putative [Plasmodium gallinaceum]|uniref:Thioredoxin-like protein 2, putative n=1 Tax=Plasmodium gallinaceum TaxID=5849 RepID=A0A1J1GZS4_PLAGA|nr:thioredoxin-like protein 2, putative [Plasmodium gallinaceum]CRG96802.1 thioredoxin-like protein 2, putative [Plasmodium gallinaceum]
MYSLKFYNKIRHYSLGRLSRRNLYTELNNMDDYLKKVNGEKLVVAQFGASWCAPCKKMKPLIKQLGEDNENIETLYIDIDEFPELGENEDINELPTFLLRKNGKYLDKIIGTNEKELIKSIEKHQKD